MADDMDYEQKHEEKIDENKATKMKTKISPDMNQVNRPKRREFQPKQ